MATEAEVLCRGRGISEGVKVVDVGRSESVSEGGELDIAVVVNQHASVSDPTDISPEVRTYSATHTHTHTHTH